MADDPGVLAADFKKGLWKELPGLRILLGLCPMLAVTSTVINSMAMGLATLFVLVAANISVALLKNIIPAKVRIPAFIIIIASFVTVVDLLMNAYLHSLHKTLGIFIPLIVVNCLVLGRAEAFASKNSVIRSVADAFGMGLGFTLVLMTLGIIRELLGFGTVFGFTVLGSFYKPMLIMILPPGAFIALGVMLAAVNRMSEN